MKKFFIALFLCYLFSSCSSLNEKNQIPITKLNFEPTVKNIKQKDIDFLIKNYTLFSILCEKNVIASKIDRDVQNGFLYDQTFTFSNLNNAINFLTACEMSTCFFISEYLEIECTDVSELINKENKKTLKDSINKAISFKNYLFGLTLIKTEKNKYNVFVAIMKPNI